MNSLKKPETVITLINTAALLGASIYFYRKTNNLELELNKHSEHLTSTIKKVKEIANTKKHIAALANAIKELNNYSAVQNRDLETLKDIVRYQNSQIAELQALVLALKPEDNKTELKLKENPHLLSISRFQTPQFPQQIQQNQFLQPQQQGGFLQPQQQQQFQPQQQGGFSQQQQQQPIPQPNLRQLPAQQPQYFPPQNTGRDSLIDLRNPVQGGGFQQGGFQQGGFQQGGFQQGGFQQGLQGGYPQQNNFPQQGGFQQGFAQGLQGGYPQQNNFPQQYPQQNNFGGQSFEEQGIDDEDAAINAVRRARQQNNDPLDMLF